MAERSGTSTHELSSFEGLAAAAVALLSPILMYAGHLGAVAKFAYPTSAFLAAGYFWVAGLAAT